ncbi:CCA-adding enzyme [compost metagenome]
MYEPGELSINGQDLLAGSGRQGGPWLGAVLKELTYLVASKQLTNEKQVLLEWAQRKVNQDGA